MIDFDTYYDWCKDRFGEENLKIKNTSHGVEICTHSFFAKQKLGIDDHKYHLWMCPEGGKKKLGGGGYRCWYTDAMGSLIELVALVDQIDYDDAEELITGCTSLRALERKVHEFFGTKSEVPPPEPPTDFQLPNFSFLIDKLPPRHFWRTRAKNYLNGRKLPSDGLYVCTDGEHRNRIVIPYYDRSGKLMWWNARTMSNHKKTRRYAKPTGDQESVLYMTTWPEPGRKVYVMEGEFDAKSLGLAGLAACACGGKYLSEAQMELLREYRLVLAFDADESGRGALIDTGRALLSSGFSQIGYVRPPVVYKDWNALLVQRNVPTLKAYIERFEKPFTSTTAEFLLSQSI